MNVDGKAVLVTGAGTRVGRAIAEHLAQHGARVAIHYNTSEAGANELSQRIEHGGGKAAVFRADLSDAQTHEPLLDEVAGKFGSLDVLINSAAIMEPTPIETVSVDAWDRILAINLRAPFFLSLKASDFMRKGAGAGVIVNIGDLAAFEAWPDYAVHGISKAGVDAMTRILAKLLAPHIRVNSIAPGAVLLPEGWPEDEVRKIVSSTPLGRIGSPQDVAQAVAYLIEADYVTGETLIVDGGRSIRR